MQVHLNLLRRVTGGNTPFMASHFTGFVPIVNVHPSHHADLAGDRWDYTLHDMETSPDLFPSFSHQADMAGDRWDYTLHAYTSPELFSVPRILYPAEPAEHDK